MSAVRFRPKAARGVFEAARYLLEQAGPAVAGRFVAGLAEATACVSGMPPIGSPVPLRRQDLQCLRSWPVTGFRSYFVYYLASDGTITVVRVLHASRDRYRLLVEADES